MADWTPESRSEEILFATINGEEYNGLPESRIEELLLELKEVIEAGGGGGGGGAVNSVNGKTGNVVLDASDVGALPSSTTIPTKTSDLNNDSNFVADASYVHTDNNYDDTAKGVVDGVGTALAGKVDKVDGKGLSTNDYDNTAKGIVDGVTTALAGKQDTISDLAAIRSGAAAGATAVQPSQLPGVATTQTAGLIKPDGTTITITQDGTISSVGGGDEGELLTGTLLAASWSNKSQTVSVTGLNSSDIGVVGVLDTATSAQLAAAEGVTPVSVSNGTITFICEDVPAVDIPFGIVVTGTSSNGNLPDGGTTGQVLKKKSNTDLDVEWGTIPDTTKMYSTDDTAFTDIADGDYIPVYDTSATTKKKSLWSNIKSLLKTYFDTLYQKKLAYSTSEQVIGTWITGKPIYQRVYTGTLNKTTSAGTEASTEISVGASVSAFIALKGFVISDGNSYQTIPTYRYSGGQQYLRITGNTNMASSSVNKIFVNNAWYTGNASYVVIAQYTKTTD